MSRNTEHKPTSVPFPAKQVGEIESRWDWVELCVWTDCMLTALEKGVKGGKQSLLCRIRAVLLEARL